MDKNDFMGLETLRSDLKAKKLETLHKEQEITDTRKRLKERLIPMERDLKIKQTELSKDKDKRAEHDCSNQTDWNAKIKNELLVVDQEEIDQVKIDHESLIKELEESVQLLKIDITDLEWKLRIRIVFYTTEGDL